MGRVRSRTDMRAGDFEIVGTSPEGDLVRSHIAEIWGIGIADDRPQFWQDSHGLDHEEPSDLNWIALYWGIADLPLIVLAGLK